MKNMFFCCCCCIDFMTYLTFAIFLLVSSTPGPLYNTLRYNTVLDITLISVGPQLDYFAICLYLSLSLAYLSRRLTGELIVYPCSGVRLSSIVIRPSSTISKIFSSETAWPIKAKLHAHPYEGGTKVCINGPGHMTKMAAMAINSENL